MSSDEVLQAERLELVQLKIGDDGSHRMEWLDDEETKALLSR